MESKQLGPRFAAEILGVNLSAAMSDGEFDAIKQVWLENKVAVFRDQNLSDNDLSRFTERFGPLFVLVRSQFNDKTRPGIMLISNIKENCRDLGALGSGDLAWHSDQSYSADPVFATLIYAIAIPMEGGGTWFCDTARAYENLPADEGAALLAALEDWAGRPEFTYMHEWRVGDVVMWDNTSTMHRRDAFSADERRLLKRTGSELPPERAVPF